MSVKGKGHKSNISGLTIGFTPKNLVEESSLHVRCWSIRCGSRMWQPLLKMGTRYASDHTLPQRKRLRT